MPTTALQQIKAAAVAAGFTVTDEDPRFIRVERDATLDPSDPIAKVAAIGGWTPREGLFVSFTGEPDSLRLYSAGIYLPKYQSVLTGSFVDYDDIVGTNKKGQALAWLNSKKETS